MAESEGENVMFQWNDFSENISSSLRDVYRDEDLFDVTLVTETGDIRAHKLILSACSQHFRKILQRLKSHANPVIYLNGINHSDLTAILEFMYSGEVSVPKDDVESFFNTARAFMVNGLVNTDDLTTSIPAATPTVASTSSSSRPSSATLRASPTPQGVKIKREKLEATINSAKRKKTVNLTSSVTLSPSVTLTPSSGGGGGGGASALANHDQDPNDSHEGNGLDYNEDDYNGDLTMDNDQENEEMTIEPFIAADGDYGPTDNEQDALAYEINEYIANMSGRTTDGKYQCLICGLASRDLYNQREHLMTHMTKDDHFNQRFELFLKSNIQRTPRGGNSFTTVCTICSIVIKNVKKHFLSKHLRWQPKGGGGVPNIQ